MLKNKRNTRRQVTWLARTSERMIYMHKWEMEGPNWIFNFVQKLDCTIEGSKCEKQCKLKVNLKNWMNLHKNNSKDLVRFLVG
jgi:hypothetical protein